ncbi:MAG: hypothetical protein EOP07_18955 [Proteobacteria bacterium]|nr:MAG: hypothetical protein EOP07_18955 [Pseudomonadota bacterium]
MNSQLKIALLGFGLSLQTACVPAFLDKYKREEVRASQAKSAAAPGSAATASTPAPSSSRSARATAGITQIADTVFRVPMTYDRTWDTMVDVLLRNYNLQIVEKSTGILTTEWDSYYLDGKVHRNKVSIRLKRIGNQGVDLTVHNNVEVLSRVPDGVSEIWLPSDRFKPEIGRIIQNLAIASGQPKPKLAADFTPSGEAPKPTM